MAGIGFELRKIFHKNTIHSNVAGVLYATATVLGPTILFLIFMVVVQLIFYNFKIPQESRDFFSAATIYIFVMATFISGAFNYTATRYIADLMYESNYQGIGTALYGLILSTGVISGIAGLILCLHLNLIYHVPVGFLVGYDLFGIMITVSYAINMFISSLSEYSKITKAYFVGLSAAIGIFAFLYYMLHIAVLTAIIFGMAIGFFIINFIIIFYAMKAFDLNDFSRVGLKGRWNMQHNGCFYFYRYFKKYPKLAIGGFSYNIGLFTPGIIYWFLSDISESITGFKVAPAYDTAVFLAMFANLSSMVIFTVKVETKFYEKYKNYLGALNYANYATLEQSKEKMKRTIGEQLFYIYEIQLVITLLALSLAVLFFPMLGIGGLTLDFFLLLAIGFYCMYSMYFTIIFLYYFDDQTGALISTITFFAVSLILALIAVRLGTGYYPLPLLIGSIIAWIISFIRLRYYVENINAILFTRY
ncbi:MAG: hypothetical protein K0R92_1894 [Lachnospiraceae bacterium]|jgi:uncharacterized membrane protein|nr:hypothetical protein [Lachnospiraceae bacterium]